MIYKLHEPQKEDGWYPLARGRDTINGIVTDTLDGLTSDERCNAYECTNKPLPGGYVKLIGNKATFISKDQALIEEI